MEILLQIKPAYNNPLPLPFEQKVQECDATMFGPDSWLWPQKKQAEFLRCTKKSNALRYERRFCLAKNSSFLFASNNLSVSSRFSFRSLNTS